MSNQPAFFLSKFEIFQKENPEKFEKKTRKSSTGKEGTRKTKPNVFNCSTCGLDTKCNSGRIKRRGKSGNILIVGLCPGKREDEQGTLFVGSSGSYLNTILKSFGVSFYGDCVHTNIVQCAIRKKNKKTGTASYSTPDKTQIKCCAQNLENDIKEVKPDLIICLGGAAMRAVLSPKHVKLPPIMKMHGKVLPSLKYNCWVGCSFHPSFILQGKKKDEAVFKEDFLNIFSKLGESIPKPLTMEGNVLVEDSTEAVELLKTLSKSSKPTAFDYETNGFSSHVKDAKLITVSLSNDIQKGYCIHLNNPNWNLVEQAHVYHYLKLFLKSDVPKVVQNYNMEELWSRNLVGSTINNFIWDTMVTSHVINCRMSTTSLGFQVYELTGLEYKDMVDTSDLENEPIELVSDYNNLDSRHTLMLYEHQKKTLDNLEDKKLINFNNFYTSCLEPLANLKDYGIRIDRELLENFYVDYTKSNEELLKTIDTNQGVQEFKKLKEKEFNIASPKQLGEVLYKIYKIKPVKQTATGESTDAEALDLILEQTDNKDAIELINSLLRFRKISSFLKRVVQYKELVDEKGFIHPTYNLNIAESYRSSATNPNCQNIYKRDEELIIFRKIIIPSPDNVLLECDYDALEVKVIAMASRDKNLTEQILNGVDPHTKWASEIYEKNPEDVTKEERYDGKNKFVFPSFYGSRDTSIFRSFPSKSSRHVSKTQSKFWKEYSSVKDWQNRTLAIYDTRGYVRGLSGFKRPGPLSINQLYNTPIQGTAFHLLLDGLRTIDKEILRRGLKSRAFMEVHDSITFDAVLEEVEELIALANEVLCAKRFDWQGVIPTTISWEIGENWFEMDSI